MTHDPYPDFTHNKKASQRPKSQLVKGMAPTSNFYYECQALVSAAHPRTVTTNGANTGRDLCRGPFRDRETLRHWLLPHLTHDVTTGSALMTACADGLAFALGEMAGLVGALRPRRHPRRAGLSSGPAQRLSGWKWSATAATASQARRWPAW
jgi:hypothetical protein